MKRRFKSLEQITKRIDHYLRFLNQTFEELSAIEAEEKQLRHPADELPSPDELWKLDHLRERERNLERRLEYINRRLSRLKAARAEFLTPVFPEMETGDTSVPM